LIVPLAVVALLVALCAFYVAAEFAAVSARRTRIEHLADGGDRAAAVLRPILTDSRRLDTLVAASQLGITATNLVLGFYGQLAFAEPLVAPRLTGLGLSAGAATGAAATLVLIVLTIALVLFGEIVPKAIALRHPERVALAAAYPMLLSMRLFRPLIWMFNGAGNLLLRPFGRSVADQHRHLHSPQEIELLVAESTHAGELDPVEREMLRNAIDLAELVARQIMIPRNQLAMAEVGAPVSEMLALVADSPHNRLPVFERDRDHVLGVVHLKDLLRLSVAGGGDVRDAVRRVPFLPETVPITEVWQKLIVDREPAAVLLDEYGGTAGLVTQEDLIEEVIGEVLDEFDIRPEGVVYRDGQPPLVRADLLVEEVNDELGIDLPTDGADTLGGLVVSLLGRIAAPGDAVVAGLTELRVHSVRGRSILRVAVTGPGGAVAGHSGGADEVPE
jgi:CBS domain containing-hemolysin-like protein